METVKTFNILIVGKAGSGKSATAKLLTGDPSILVGNGPKEVTTAVTCFAGASLNVNGEYVQFKIMDIPGLDKFENRGLIREQLLC